MARRLRERRRGRRLSLRRTLRASVATGGLPVRLHRRLRRMPPVKLALFVDVSGSMDAYSAFFMRFVHALTGRFQQAEAFLFHTQLAHISGPLREADPVKMLEKMTLISQGWSGGTRIGAAIRDFNTHYADIAGGSRTVAVILSDGYDTGAPDELAAALHQLRARTHKVFWLNPMIGRDGYAPETRAMAAALPYLDLFAPAHNLESLEALEQALVRA
ncbi:MAG: VWA domain-containing protein [Pseudomonadota bacterium]